MFELFREKQKSKEGSYVYRAGSEWFSEMFSVLERADLKDRKKPEAVRAVLERTRRETVGSNIIPIGIINAEAVMLTEEQSRENISAKSEGKRPDAASYEYLEMILHGLLQDEIFQGDVQFRIAPELVQSNT